MKAFFSFLTPVFPFLPSPWSLSFINDRLTGLEKTFLNPEGLPGRPLYWYVVTMQIRALIGLKPCFYNSIETQNYTDVMMARTKRIYILMIEVNKLFFFFFVAVFSKRNRKHVLRVPIEL